MTTPELINLSALIDNAKCFALVRQHRWPDGVCCPTCGSGTVVRDGGMTRNRTGNATAARRVRGASTTSRVRCWPDTISRCASGST